VADETEIEDDKSEEAINKCEIEREECIIADIDYHYATT
jgi:hypothetical protein